MLSWTEHNLPEVVHNSQFIARSALLLRALGPRTHRCSRKQPGRCGGR